MLGVSLVSLLIIPAIAERTIVIDKIADVKEEFLFDVLSDVKNYRQIFPEYVQSIQLIQNDLGNVADIAGSAKGFGYTVQIAYESEPSMGKISQAVVKGDYSGSRMTTTLTKTYGFDGTPQGGTKIHAELKIKSSGWFSALSFVSDEQIKFGVEGAFDKLIQRSKDMESGKISTTVTPSNTSILESPVTIPTKPPVTTPPPVTSTTSPKLPTMVFQSSSVNGMSVTIYGNAQSGTGKQLSNISWDWGDGQSSTGQFPQSHIYAQYGTYTVTAIVIDAGLSTSSTTSVTISTPTVQQTNPPITKPETKQTIPNSITVTTNKKIYTHGETILVTGEVREIISGFPVSLRVESPNGHLVSVAQIDIGSDKKFSTELTAGGELMRNSGTYTTVVLYGTEAPTAKTSFEYIDTMWNTLRLDPLPTSVKALDTIVFSGQFTASDKSPISGRTINIKDDIDFSSDNLVSVAVTDENGRFYVTTTAYPRGSGAYDFYAVFEGDNNYGRTRSNTYSVTVN